LCAINYVSVEHGWNYLVGRSTTHRNLLGVCRNYSVFLLYNSRHLDICHLQLRPLLRPFYSCHLLNSNKKIFDPFENHSVPLKLHGQLENIYNQSHYYHQRHFQRHYHRNFLFVWFNCPGIAFRIDCAPHYCREGSNISWIHYRRISFDVDLTIKINRLIF
jgi:hypothetical protein